MNKFAFRFLCVLMFVAVLIFSGVFSTHRIAGLNDTASAQAAIQLIPVLSGLDNPLYVTSARDGSNRLFIVEQPGRIKVLTPGATAPLQTPFLDIIPKVFFEGENGFLGLAFHPQYKTNGRFFVNYTRRPNNAIETVISEFKVSASDPNVAETEERVLLTIAQPYGNHKGGWIDFGPDGFLYIATGDGGSGNDPDNRSQNNNELLGKMLRIDVNTSGTAPYTSPATNPFFGSTPGRDEIYATGLRNPFRCSFDRGTGKLYAGDVGQGIIEEISVITLGGNYGWRVYEGTRCTNLGPAPCTASNYVMPLVEYDHFTNGRCSVTGGYVYRGTRNSLPADSYVFGDFCSGEIFLFNGSAMSLLFDTELLISSFGEDEAGEIYVVDLRGSIFRLAAPSSAAVASAANYRNSSLAVESIVAAFGENFATTTQAAPGGQLPTTLAGLSVNVLDSAGTNRLAPLFYVSPTQVNFQIPQGTAIGSASAMLLSANGSVARSGMLTIQNVTPGLFSADGSGNGLAAALAYRIRGGVGTFEPIARFDQASNQFVALPIDLGPQNDQVFLVGFGTGFRFRGSLNAVTATIGGTPAQVIFAGAQPNFVGLDQTNILLPRSLAGRGAVDVVFTVEGLPANTVRVSIK